MQISDSKWKVGDKIENRYEIHQILEGGMGVVYICYDHESGNPLALKTFQARYLESQQIRERFIREAETWVELEKHQNIVRAEWVQNIQGKPYIGLEFIANPEMGGADLGRWIRRGMEVSQVLNFAVQFCDGIDYAHKKLGLVHRDIKPGNILVTQDRMVKITDFGLVKTLLAETSREDFLKTAEEEAVSDRVSFTRTGALMGTPPYMSPEQCRNAREVDIRSDIYAFGAVLYEMLTGRWVFEAATSAAFVRCHLSEFPPTPASLVPGLPQELEVTVLRCLAKDPKQRYPNFMVLREELAKMYQALTGKQIALAVGGEALETWEWYNKGVSLHHLKHPEEALVCYDRALDINPTDADVWVNKGVALSDLGHYEEALACYARVLDVDPRFAPAWSSKGVALDKLGHCKEALACYDQALAIDPKPAKPWYNKGVALAELGHYEEALACYDRALDINPTDADVWYAKGGDSAKLGYYEEALVCYDRALVINPRYAEVWSNKGASLFNLGRVEEALACYDRALAINPRYIDAWVNKGTSLSNLGRVEEALTCNDRALTINPECAEAWSNKGNILTALGQVKEALVCCDRALVINPKFALAWLNKGATLAISERFQEALGCFTKVLEIDPSLESAKKAIAFCQQRLKYG